MKNKKPGYFHGKPSNKAPGNYCGICWNKITSKPENQISVWLETPNRKSIRLGYVCKDCRSNLEGDDFSGGGVID